MSQLRIRKVAVLGAGVMGAQIAAHLANAGIPTLLLDLTADVTRDGLKRATALRPDPFFARETVALIRTGGFDNDLPQLDPIFGAPVTNNPFGLTDIGITASPTLVDIDGDGDSDLVCPGKSGLFLAENLSRSRSGG